MDVFFWIGFLLLIGILLFLDLGVFNKKSHVVSTKEALMWTFIWICVSLTFNVFIYFAYENQWIHSAMEGVEKMDGWEAAITFLTGYIIEKSLSLDNIFVIAMIFGYFKIPLIHQHRILYWGILGAIVFRGVMIVAGTALIQQFDWIMYVFGAFLIISAIKMLITRDDDEDYDGNKNPIIKWAKKWYPVTNEINGKFFIKIDGIKHITPIFLCLLVIETTDIMFAIDSIPAIFAVTTDSFIVFSSNIFAILGLRSLYFALAAMMEQFRYIKLSLVFVLAFVGVKMMLIDFFHFPSWVSLSIIIGLLSIGVIASIWAGKKDPAKLHSPIDKENLKKMDK